jgi:cyclic lactone autoinducer peptide
MKGKHQLLLTIARVGYISAMNAAGTASRYGTYETKEPEALVKLRNQK